MCNVEATCKSPNDAKNYTHYAREIAVFCVDIENDTNAFGEILFAFFSPTLSWLSLPVIFLTSVVAILAAAVIIFCVDCNTLSLFDAHKSVLRDRIGGTS